MENPLSFWENSSIGASAAKEITVTIPFELPQIPLKKDSPELLFDFVAKRLITISPDEFMKGYINLDHLWATSEDLTIKKIRETKSGEKTLLEIYPEPYSGRRAYLCQIAYSYLYSKDSVILVDAETGLKVQKLGGLKPIKEGSKRYLMKIAICKFRNVTELFWTKKDLPSNQVKDETTGELIELPPEQIEKEEYKYERLTTWVKESDVSTIDKIGNMLLAKKPDILSTFGFVICLKLTPSSNPDKFKMPSLNFDKFYPLFGGKFL